MNFINDNESVICEETVINKFETTKTKVLSRKDYNTNFNNTNFNNSINCIPSPTDLRISTITAVCQTNLNVNLSQLINRIDSEIIDCNLSDNEGIIKSVFGNTVKGNKQLNKKKKFEKCFYNQVTNIIRIKKDGNYKEINVKIFNNGKLQLTGLKKKEDGIYCIELLLKSFNNIHKMYPDDIFKFSGDKITYHSFEVVLINSDYSARFKIKRDKLHEILINDYNLYSSYEPCIYPGVNSKYYWNDKYNNFPNKGICYCTEKCDGKGNGSGNGQCKKITISIFQSGNVIITGARTFEQINSAYLFINDVFKTNFDTIKRKNIPFLDINTNRQHIRKDNSEKVIILLKKTDIVFKNKKIFS